MATLKDRPGRAEPTSGLDSTTAMNLVASLCQLAAGGRSIITTIHQVNMGMHCTCCVTCTRPEPAPLALASQFGISKLMLLRLLHAEQI